MKRGAVVIQETRGFDEKTMVTVPQRVKETAADYRFIPDPDIPPQDFKEDYISSIKLPQTPQIRKRRLVEQYGVSEYYASVMVHDKDIADLFETIAPNLDKQAAAMWICQEVLRQLNYRNIDLRESKLTSQMVAELIKLVTDGKITENVGKKILERVIDSGESPARIASEEGLGKVSAVDELTQVVDQVLADNPSALADYKAGQPKAMNFLMGKVMAKMKGRADNKVVGEILKTRI
jgi:aspartyl-tRNA(Asn)/glutamyl-tRNA(Gln) amidotransferase subunit B